MEEENKTHAFNGKKILLLGRKYETHFLEERASHFNEIHSLYALKDDLPLDTRPYVTRLAAFHRHERRELLQDHDLLFENYPKYVAVLTWESIDHAKATIPRRVLTSSLACLLYSIIIEEDLTSLSLTLHGFPLGSDTEYFHQREAVSYLLGYLESAGTRIHGYELLYENEGVYGRELEL